MLISAYTCSAASYSHRLTEKKQGHAGPLLQCTLFSQLYTSLSSRQEQAAKHGRCLCCRQLAHLSTTTVRQQNSIARAKK